MARQLGHVNYGGTIGGIRHFKIKGLSGNFAGLKGGATGEQIKNDAAFVRTRENMNEFGGCALVGKSLRSGLAQLMKQMSDPQLTGRLTGIMKKINLEDQSEARGYRAVLVSQQPQYLLGLNFNRHSSFEGLFTGTVETTATAERNAVTLSVEPFSTLSNVNAPAGATHFRLVNAITVLSDFAYNATTKVYEPIEPTLNETSKITYSDYIELESSVAAPLSVESILPGNPTMTADVSLISCVGIEFYQKVGANYYIFSVGNSLKIKNIF
ncbi:hypothetical protein RDV77_03825 [Porphyromonadaceae sp. NP-X]|jgi:hypothetical protein|nr:hypothetical protein [Porphyromonadaceae sp. NP-X]